MSIPPDLAATAWNSSGAALSSQKDADTAKGQREPATLHLGRAAALIFAWVGVWIIYFTPPNLGIPLRLAQIDPSNRYSNLGYILSLGTLCSIFMNPVWGSLSDRTRWRWGRRRPYILVGLAGSAISLFLLATASSAAGIGFAWCLMHVAHSAAMTAILASIADSTPPQHLGTMSAIAGVATTISPALSAAIAKLCGDNIELLILLPFSVTALALPLLVLVMKDCPAPPQPPFRLKHFASNFWINPLRNKNFGFAALSKFILYIAFNYYLVYRVYFLLDRLGVDQKEIAGIVLLVNLLTSATTILAALAFGWLSDQIGQRRPFVRLSCLAIGTGLLIVGYADTMPLFYLGTTCIGAGMGCFRALEAAWAISVRPANSDNGKVLGLLFSAGLIGQFVSPLTTGIFFTGHAATQRDYMILFSVGAAMCFLAAALLQPIRERLTAKGQWKQRSDP